MPLGTLTCEVSRMTRVFEITAGTLSKTVPGYPYDSTFVLKLDTAGAPFCVNPSAARTYLPGVLMKAKLVLAGKSKTEIAQAVTSAPDEKELPALESGAMCHMMSKQQYLNDHDKSWHPHLMWLVPGGAAKSWGANMSGWQIPAADDPEDRMTIFLVWMGHWSDGTPAPQGYARDPGSACYALTCYSTIDGWLQAPATKISFLSAFPANPATIRICRSKISIAQRPDRRNYCANVFLFAQRAFLPVANISG